MIKPIIIAAKIKAYRKEKEISMDKVEEELNIDQIRQYDIETASVVPTKKELTGYADLFQIPLTALIN